MSLVFLRQLCIPKYDPFIFMLRLFWNELRITDKLTDKQLNNLDKVLFYTKTKSSFDSECQPNITKIKKVVMLSRR